MALYSVQTSEPVRASDSAPFLIHRQMRHRRLIRLMLSISSVAVFVSCDSRTRTSVGKDDTPEAPIRGIHESVTYNHTQLRLEYPVGTHQLVESTTSELDLIAAFGAGNVTRERVPVGEGDSLTATVLFSEDSIRRLEIFWSDTVARSAPASTRLLGSRSSWSVGPLVTLGAGLGEITIANGGPFTLAGFSWDYEGTVTSWEGGRLDSLAPGLKRIIVRFRPSANDQVSDAERRHIAGDGNHASTNPLIQRVNPRVYAIEVWFLDGGVGRAGPERAAKPPPAPTPLYAIVPRYSSIRS